MKVSDLPMLRPKKDQIIVRGLTDLYGLYQAHDEWRQMLIVPLNLVGQGMVGTGQIISCSFVCLTFTLEIIFTLRI